MFWIFLYVLFIYCYFILLFAILNFPTQNLLVVSLGTSAASQAHGLFALLDGSCPSPIQRDFTHPGPCQANHNHLPNMGWYDTMIEGRVTSPDD